MGSQLVQWRRTIFVWTDIAGECRMAGMYKRLGVLASRGGRGFFAFMIGSIALVLGIQQAEHAEVYWMAIAGAYSMISGCFMMSSYCCKGTGEHGDYTADQLDDDQYNMLAGND